MLLSYTSRASLKQGVESEESMEGAAVAYCAAQFSIPWMEIRCISNYVERRDTTLWNIPLAVKNLNEKIIEWLNSEG